MNTYRNNITQRTSENISDKNIDFQNNKNKIMNYEKDNFYW